MITFNQLNITSSGKCLIIDASVDSSSYYNDVGIDSIIIDSQDTFIPNGPSSNPIYINNLEENLVKVYTDDDKVLDENDSSLIYIDEYQRIKHIRLILSDNELSVPLDKSMLFVYIIAKGYPSPDTPCGYDNSKVMGTVINLYPYYLNMMRGIKELNNTCNVPQYFIDNILRFKAIELSIKTGNYLLAIEYWKKFFNNLNNITYKDCKCYGGNN